MPAHIWITPRDTVLVDYSYMIRARHKRTILGVALAYVSRW